MRDKRYKGHIVNILTLKIQNGFGNVVKFGNILVSLRNLKFSFENLRFDLGPCK